MNISNDTTCEAARYAPDARCSDSPPKHHVVYRSSSGAIMDDHPACFAHGMAEVDRHHASGGVARCDLEANPVPTPAERTDRMAPSLISGGDDDPNPYNVIHLPDLPHSTDPARQLRWDVDLDGDGDIAVGLFRGDELLACSAQASIEGAERYAIRVLRNHLAVERMNQADQ